MKFSDKLTVFAYYSLWVFLVSSAIVSLLAILMLLLPHAESESRPIHALISVIKIGVSFFLMTLIFLVKVRNIKEKIKFESILIDDVAVELSRSGIPNRINGRSNILIFYGDSKLGEICSAIIDFKEMAIYFKASESLKYYDCLIDYNSRPKDISDYIKAVIDGSYSEDDINLNGWAFGESVAESCFNRVVSESIVLKFSEIDKEINRSCTDPRLVSLGFMDSMAKAESQGLIKAFYSDSLDEIFYCPKDFCPESIEGDGGSPIKDLRPLR